VSCPARRRRSGRRAQTLRIVRQLLLAEAATLTPARRGRHRPRSNFVSFEGKEEKEGRARRRRYAFLSHVAVVGFAVRDVGQAIGMR
jgi:hypothetical protein